MLIAITSSGKTICSHVDQRFGRTKYFAIYNTENQKFNFYDNQINSSLVQGAGIQTAQKIVEYDVDVLITGNCGPKAFQVLNAANIKVFQATDLTIQETIEAYLKENLIILEQPNVKGHW